jgi:phosphoribosylformimino-5-aminoimidazole carboxamide ribotide isomerase
MTELFPAIDLLDGSYVRLSQGDYGRSTVYGADPSEIVAQFIAAGSAWIHVVDLNAARGDGPVNRTLIAAMAAQCSAAGVKLQTGGGVRSVDDAHALFDAGVSRVVVGTAAVREPSVISTITNACPHGLVAVGLDAHLQPNGTWDVAVQGWTQTSGKLLFDVLKESVGNGASAVVATDIARDGMLTGPATQLYADILDFAKHHDIELDVIASGGVSGPHDVAALATLPGLAGVIAGRAIYEGHLDVAEGVRLCRHTSHSGGLL